MTRLEEGGEMEKKNQEEENKQEDLVLSSFFRPCLVPNDKKTNTNSAANKEQIADGLNVE